MFQMTALLYNDQVFLLTTVGIVKIGLTSHDPTISEMCGLALEAVLCHFFQANPTFPQTCNELIASLSIEKVSLEVFLGRSIFSTIPKLWLKICKQFSGIQKSSIQKAFQDNYLAIGLSRPHLRYDLVPTSRRPPSSFQKLRIGTYLQLVHDNGSRQGDLCLSF